MLAVGPTGGSPLLFGYAGELGGHTLHSEICRQTILKRNEGWDEVPPHIELNLLDLRAGSALHWACCQRLVDAAQALIDCPHFSLVNAARPEDGSTALHLAAAEGLTTVVQALLSSGRFLSMDALDKDGFTALHAAAWRGHFDIVEELLASPEGRALSGVEGNFDIARGPRSWAAEAASESDCRTALHFAALGGHADICEALLILGPTANPDATNRVGATALHMAARGLHTKACNALLTSQNFTKLDARDTRGFTALHWAAHQASGDICAAILARPDFTAVEFRDLQGRTAAEVAMRKGYHEVRRLILQRLGPAALRDGRL
mmetsp:Transcript_51292/g.109037  ORF Transcript_51292/g.109037 Transcript_51292/m.109037 type:complete len:321 (+) Transcript_51292:37-999(+)|eukprot:CAMPEP_0206424662 /NCGR_PEP_ID=MMETSP0324_2-20121206/3361_1 /ASSEMBLY_ACC=CAM_ASM_000836 /TAXON_ID=2866 /ORGANISM="Crypthecodinium cohnii, Strain Seligo" /LENGTH=320 /DNA_ID=CAMNT_0053889359 /DNA_START=147 /DNA_END=1109 /DNA_ORIENTATION=-